MIDWPDTNRFSGGKTRVSPTPTTATAAAMIVFAHVGRSETIAMIATPTLKSDVVNAE